MASKLLLKELRYSGSPKHRVPKWVYYTNKYSIPPSDRKTPHNNEKKDKSPKRAMYFKKNRSKRQLLKAMENTTIVDPHSLTRKDYRAIRHLYYRGIDQIFRYLCWQPDRDRVLEVEKDLYNMMLSYHFIKDSGKIRARPKRNNSIFHTQKPKTISAIAETPTTVGLQKL